MENKIKKISFTQKKNSNSIYKNNKLALTFHGLFVIRYLRISSIYLRCWVQMWDVVVVVSVQLCEPINLFNNIFNNDRIDLFAVNKVFALLDVLLQFGNGGFQQTLFVRIQTGNSQILFDTVLADFQWG